MQIESVSADIDMQGGVAELHIYIRGTGPEDLEKIKKALLIITGKPLDVIVPLPPGI